MKQRFSIDEVVKRSDKANVRKENWRDLYSDCYEFALPQRNLYDGYYTASSPGQKKMSNVFDSTAINSVQRFANRLQSGLFPPYRNWCRLMVGEVAKQQIGDPVELQRALDVYTDKLFTIIRQTNFDLTISEFLLDLCVGTGAMLIQKNDTDNGPPVRFEAVPQFLIAFEEGPNGKVQNVYRNFRVKAGIITQQWTDAKLTPELNKLIEDDPTQDIELLEATMYMPDTGRYCYHIIHRHNTKGKSSYDEIVYRKMDSSPWVICRYSKVAGEIYGRGPLVSCIADVKTLNKTKEMILRNASISIAGVYTARDDGVLNPNNIRIAPGSIISVASNGGGQGPSLQPLQRASDFNVAQIVIKDLVENIKRTLMDDSLPPDTMSARSATEVVQRMKELATNLGSAFGRLITEALIPIVTRTLHVMKEQKIIDLPVEVDGNVIKIYPQSPLAQAQNMDDLQTVLQFMQVAQGLGPIGQVVINQDNMIEYLAQKMGIPGEIMNSREERREIIKQLSETALQTMQQGEQGELGQPQGNTEQQ